LFVTHDQVEAMTLAQRMIVMNGGVMEQFGTPEEVYTRPASTFVATFIGSPPMNLLKNAPGARVGTLTGVRPEHLDITPTGWALTVEAVEMLGAERLIYGKWAATGDSQSTQDDEWVIIRTEESRGAPALGSTLHVTPRPDRMHSFDATTGKRLEPV
jgi:sn-glycerol 3-phosphate transport system ATP-binding protein